jgi:xanthine dehydrogenase YagS FAD-binding subunit
MRPFAYARAADALAAVSLGRETLQGQTDAPTQFLAGGTTLIDLMKLGVLTPKTIVDIEALRSDHGGIRAEPQGLRLGALVRMSEAADDPVVRRDYPAIADSLKLAASPQLRNMASLGGNVLQRTRCPYYRDPSWADCGVRGPAARRSRASTTITPCSGWIPAASPSIPAISAWRSRPSGRRSS